MKGFVGFMLLSAIGAASVSVLCGILFSTVPAATASPITLSNKVYEDKYLCRIIDSMQFALALRATNPELVPEWLEAQIIEDVHELTTSLRGNSISRDALQMIAQYYAKNNLEPPQEIRETLAGILEHNSLQLSIRLSEIDRAIAAQRLGQTE